MSRRIIFALICSLSTVGAQAGVEGDPKAGKMVYEKHCTSCHGPEVFTRANRSAKNKKQILAFAQENCNRAIQPPLGIKDLENAVSYINATWYKYDK